MSNRIRRLKNNSITAQVLGELADQLTLADTCLYHPHLAFRYGAEGTFEILQDRERSRRYHAMKRLEKQKLIRVKKAAKQYEISLTAPGKLESFRLQVLRADLLPEGKSCMVIFDIPESKRSLRKKLREFLKEAGFFCLQRSVWISQFDAAQSLADLFQSTGSAKWVRIFYCDQIFSDT